MPQLKSATEANKLAIEAGADAGLSRFWLEAVSTRKVDGKWEVLLNYFARRFKAVIDANTGEVEVWTEILQPETRQ